MLRNKTQSQDTYLYAIILIVLTYCLTSFQIIEIPTDPDAYELIVSASQLGVSHPPGYAIFNLLGYICCQFFGLIELTTAYSMAIFSWLCCGLSLIFFYNLLPQQPSLKVLGIILLISLEPFHTASLQVEVYGLQWMLVMACLWLQRQAITSARPQHYARLFFLCCGVLISHHFTSLTLIVILAVELLIRVRQKIFTYTSLIMVAPLIHVGYLVIRGSIKNAFNPWADLSNFSNLWYHLSASEYARNFVKIPDLAHIQQSASIILGLWHPLIWIIILIMLMNGMKVATHRWFVEHFSLVMILLLSLVQNQFYAIHDIWLYYLVPLGILVLIICNLFSISKAQLFTRLLSIIGIIFGIFWVISNPPRSDQDSFLTEVIRTEADQLSDSTKSGSKKSLFLARRYDFIFPLYYSVMANNQRSRIVINSTQFDRQQGYEWLMHQLKQEKIEFNSMNEFFSENSALFKTNAYKNALNSGVDIRLAKEIIRTMEFLRLIHTQDTERQLFVEVNQLFANFLNDYGFIIQNCGSWYSIKAWQPEQVNDNPVFHTGIVTLDEQGSMLDNFNLKAGDQLIFRIQFLSEELVPKQAKVILKGALEHAEIIRIERTPSALLLYGVPKSLKLKSGTLHFYLQSIDPNRAKMPWVHWQSNVALRTVNNH